MNVYDPQPQAVDLQYFPRIAASSTTRNDVNVFVANKEMINGEKSFHSSFNDDLRPIFQESTAALVMSDILPREQHGIDIRLSPFEQHR